MKLRSLSLDSPTDESSSSDLSLSPSDVTSDSESSQDSASPVERKVDFASLSATITENYNRAKKHATKFAIRLQADSKVAGMKKAFVIQDSGFHVNESLLGPVTTAIKEKAGKFLSVYFREFGDQIIKRQKNKFQKTGKLSPGCILFATAKQKSTQKEFCFVTLSSLSASAKKEKMAELRMIAGYLSNDKTTYIVVDEASSRYMNLIREVTVDTFSKNDQEIPVKHHHNRHCAEPNLLRELGKHKSELGDDFEVTGFVACKNYPYAICEDAKDYNERPSKWIDAPNNKFYNSFDTDYYHISTMPLCEHCARKRFAYEGVYLAMSDKDSLPLSPRSTSLGDAKNDSLSDSKDNDSRLKFEFLDLVARKEMLAKENKDVKDQKSPASGKRNHRGGRSRRKAETPSPREESPEFVTPKPVAPAVARPTQEETKSGVSKKPQTMVMQSLYSRKKITKTVVKGNTTTTKITVKETKVEFVIPPTLKMTDVNLRDILDNDDRLSEHNFTAKNRLEVVSQLNLVLEKLKLREGLLTHITPFILKNLVVKTRITYLCCCSYTLHVNVEQLEKALAGAFIDKTVYRRKTA